MMDAEIRKQQKQQAEYERKEQEWRDNIIYEFTRGGLSLDSCSVEAVDASSDTLTAEIKLTPAMKKSRPKQVQSAEISKEQKRQAEYERKEQDWRDRVIEDFMRGMYSYMADYGMARSTVREVQVTSDTMTVQIKLTPTMKKKRPKQVRSGVDK